jgi:hypothetical protein
MARATVTLGGHRYSLAGQTYVPTGGKRWLVKNRPSQLGDPGPQLEAIWDLSSEAFHSFEDVSEQGAGFLGIDYCLGTDSRFKDAHTLGPALPTVTLSTYDTPHAISLVDEDSCLVDVSANTDAPGVADNVNGMAFIATGGLYLLYLSRGNFPAKVNAVTMTLARTGLELPEGSTSVFSTRANDGTVELSLGMPSSPYQTMTTTGTLDTWTTNSASVAARILGLAPDGRIVRLASQTAAGNVLSGSITMAAPNWNTVTTIDGQAITMTGFAVDGNLWLIGTTRGPYLLNPTNKDFYPYMPEIGNDEANCHQMREWSYFGVKIPLRDGMRYFKNGVSESIGIERFGGNLSPVRGYPTAQAGSTRWGYEAWYDELTGDTWICAVRPRQVGDHHTNPQSYYPIARLTDLACEWLEIINDSNVRTNPTLVGGYGSNMFYMTLGRIEREIDDTNYTYQTSGTTYLTELRRYPHLIKDVEAWEFESSNATAARTITLGVTADGGSNGNYAAVTGNAFNRLLNVSAGVPLSTTSGRRIKPQLAFATNTSTSAPQVKGQLKLTYRLRPLEVNDYTFTVILKDDSIEGTAEAQADRILGEAINQTTLFAADADGDSEYVKLVEVIISDVKSDGGDQNSGGGIGKIAQIHAVTVPTVSGQ